VILFYYNKEIYDIYWILPEKIKECNDMKLIKKEYEKKLEVKSESA